MCLVVCEAATSVLETVTEPQRQTDPPQLNIPAEPAALLSEDRFGGVVTTLESASESSIQKAESERFVVRLAAENLLEFGDIAGNRCQFGFELIQVLIHLDC